MPLPRTLSLSLLRLPRPADCTHQLPVLISSAPSPATSKMTTIKQHRQHIFDPPINVSLPDSLPADKFDKLLTSDSNPKAAFTFPALDNWLAKLFQNFDLQTHEAHPFHKHPYKLRSLDVQAVDWFWQGRPGHEDKLGFMKIQSKIETDAYIHDSEEKARVDWVPGAVFLRGGSVAVLVRILSRSSHLVDSNPCRLLCNQKTRKAKTRSMSS
jgi:hypothetical protein